MKKLFRFKKLFALLIISISLLTLSGCIKPYDKPEYVTITPSQTAFLIPLIGDTEDQAAFESIEMLEEAKVATKEVEIPHYWSQTGRRSWTGEWRDSATVIIVERKPETREWTNSNATGTSSKLQGITAESKESITFSVSMNASAQIEEVDASKFLYRYNDKPLSEIMDDEIRARVESRFVEECAKRTMEQILQNKQEIMDIVRNDVTSYFSERGITITVLGLKGDVQYQDPKIQEAINAKFTAERNKEAQEIENQKNIEKAEAQKTQDITRAEAEAEAMRIKAEAEAEAIRLIQEQISSNPNYIEFVKWSNWNGELPDVMAGDSSSIIVDGRTLEETPTEDGTNTGTTD